MMSLQSILGDNSIESFFNEYWNKKVLHIPGEPKRSSKIFTIEDFQKSLNLQYKNLQFPAFKLIHNGNVIPESQITEEIAGSNRGTFKQLSAKKVNRYIENGATIIINNVERLGERILSFKKQLSQDLKETVQVNLYYSQPTVKGFDIHFDPHDIFVMQIHGEKEFEVFDFTNSSQNPTPGTGKTYSLKNGDILYLPKGILHHAYTDKKNSLHLSFGIRHTQKLDFIRWINSQYEKDFQLTDSIRNQDNFINQEESFSDQSLTEIIDHFIASLNEMKENISTVAYDFQNTIEKNRLTDDRIEISEE